MVALIKNLITLIIFLIRLIRALAFGEILFAFMRNEYAHQFR
ncbi:MAG: hypothetical protein ABSH11_10115 [Verrucomicrobiota bacterium]